MPAFFVELGAEISVASTAEPTLSVKPLSCRSLLTVASIRADSSCVSSMCRKRRIALSSGSRVMPVPSSANSRYSGMSCSASSIAGSERLNHCCMK